MKKYILALIIMVVLVLVPAYYHKYKVSHYYETIEPHSKLIKEIVIDTRDQDCYKDHGIYKKVYRKYNHWYSDSTYYTYWNDSIMVKYWVNENKEIVCIYYIERNKAK